MSPHVILVVLACVYATHSWNLDYSGRFPNTQEQQFRSVTLKRAQCFGLARRTRQLKINVPVIYNSRTGQTSPIPRFLLTADDNVVTRLENDGWEIRRRTTYVPQQVYERVPVCCPWDQGCDQGKPETPPAQFLNTPGSCANGGQLIYRDGQQKCECPPGFQGPWCQIPDMTGENHPNMNFPTGPLIRSPSPTSPYADMIREAEHWRSKTMQLPMLSLKDHILASVARPWANRAAMLQQQQQQNRPPKMVSVDEIHRYPQGELSNSVPAQQVLSPFDVRRNMYPWSGNPYNTIDEHGGASYPSMHDGDQNPYNTVSYQGQLPPHMLRAFSAAQHELRDSQAFNPYSRLSQDTPNPHLMALIQRVKIEQSNMNPYNRRPPTIDVPQARTPWDLDPFGQQQNPSYMNYPGMPVVPNINKRAMALALYQQMMKQRRRLPEGKSSSNRPLLNTSGFQNQMVASQGRILNQPYPLPAGSSQNSNRQPVSSSQNGNSQPDSFPLNRNSQPGSIPLNGNSQPGSFPLNGNSQPGSFPLNGNSQQGGSLMNVNNQQENLTLNGNNQSEQAVSMNNSSDVQADGQQTSVNRQPEIIVGEPSGQQQQPNLEEMNQVEQCQAILTPKLNACLQRYDLSVEEFMNPEYMQRARTVCEVSQTVGQCIRQHDKACGEGEVILTTRKLISSVLHMMGMVCQQIAARGDTPMGPMQGSSMHPVRGMPIPMPQPMSPNQQESFNNGLPLQNAEQEPPMTKMEASEQGQALPDVQSSKSSKLGSAQDGNSQPETPVSKGSVGYDSAHPVSQELKVFGYPLWLIITLGLALFVALILFVVVLCMCCRRRCRQKSGKANKEIEKIPVPLDSKIRSIDIPPPSYNTAIVLQNEDGLNLPPLDLSDETVSVSLDDSMNEKTPVEEDSDDEKDAKEEEAKQK